MSANDMDLVVVPAISLCQKRSRRNPKNKASSAAPVHVAVATVVPASAAVPFRPQLVPRRNQSWFQMTEEDDDDLFGVPVGNTSSVAPRARPKTAASMLYSLPVDAWVHVFLFCEVSAVGRMAAVCTAVRGLTWEDSQFWPAYAGRSLVDAAEVSLSASALRRAFRRWCHGFEGSWGSFFATQAATHHHADLFDDAAYLLVGLQPEDRAIDGAQINSFVEAVLAELRGFDADCDKTRERALDVVVRADAREALLPAGAAAEIQEAFEASVERAQAVPFGWRARLSSALASSRAARKPAPLPTVARRAGQSLALSVLATLGAHHQGLSTQAARQAVTGVKA